MERLRYLLHSPRPPVDLSLSFLTREHSLRDIGPGQRPPSANADPTPSSTRFVRVHLSEGCPETPSEYQGGVVKEKGCDSTPSPPPIHRPFS